MKDQSILTYANFIGLIVFIPLCIYLTMRVDQELGRMSISLNPTTAKYLTILLVPQVGVTLALLLNAAVAFFRYLKHTGESMAVYFSHSYSFAALTAWFFVILVLSIF